MNHRSAKSHVDSGNLSRTIKSNYANMAQLKDLMTAPPMTAEQHAAIMRKRIEHRRMVEAEKEFKMVCHDGFGD